MVSKIKEEIRDIKLEELFIDEKLVELGTRYYNERNRNFSKYKHLFTKKLNELISDHIFKNIEKNYTSLSPGMEKKYYRIKIEDKVYLVTLNNTTSMYEILKEEGEIIELV